MESSQKASPAEFYARNGYFVFRNLVSADLIDELLAGYRDDIAASKEPFLRQNTAQWEKNDITAHGYVRQSFLNPHHLHGHEGFSRRCLSVYALPAVREALASLTGKPTHALTQSMFFDLNTGTDPHQDYYYLDSVPAGNLLAGWFALEDIADEAGRFYVFPGSHKITFELDSDESVSNSAYLKKIAKWYAEHKGELVAPSLRKGDVLFWNSKTVHGSLPTRDPKFSRKSLTAHYLPEGYRFGNMWGELDKSLEYFDFEGMKCRVNEKQYSLGAVAKQAAKEYLDRNPAMRRLVNSAKKMLVAGR